MSTLPTLEEVNSMKKDDLKKALVDILKSLDGTNNDNQLDLIPDNSQALLKEILVEVKKSNTEREEIKTEIKSLKEENSLLQKTLLQQQRYLESIDAERRGNNIIITGLDENNILINENDNTANASTDEEKVKLIFAKIGYTGTKLVYMKRLGAPAQDKTRRPLKIVLENQDIRSNILKDARKLKDASNVYSRIYIIRDLHPGIREENGRIRAAEKREKDKPENATREVKYDRITRTLTVDGEVVDRFCPTFF